MHPVWAGHYAFTFRWTYISLLGFNSEVQQNDRKAISELIEQKAAKIIPARGKWRVIFLGFSRSGWTSGARAYQTQINQQPVAGPNWASTGLRLLELNQVDQDLASWTD